MDFRLRLLNKINYSENSVIIDVLTQNHGKCSGIVYGGSSRKIKKYLQIGNKILISCKSKNDNKIGYFKTELIQAISPIFFDNKKKILCILAAASILKILLPEQQINNKVFTSFESLIRAFHSNNWIISYIYWEQLLVKELGFDFDLFQNMKRNINKLDKYNIEINGVYYKIPKVFILKKNINASNQQIKEALQFNKHLLLANFLDGNNLRIPRSRYILENLYT